MAHFRIASLVLALVLSSGVAKAAPPLMTTPGQFAVSPTGAGTYSIPISIVPGTSGVVPSLSLSYSSQNGDGFVGIGWGLGGLPSITRCPRTLAQDGIHGSVNYDGGDRFCLDGQRLILISGTYGANGSEYRTEIESFSKITAHGSSGSGPAWFEVKTKAGQIMQFGNSVDSQVRVVSASSGTPITTARVWAVNKISDVVGNYLTVTYNCTEISGICTATDRTTYGEVYPLRIDYTGNTTAGVSPYNSVRFTYTTRGDSTPAYQAGGVVKPTVVLTSIKTYQGSSTVIQDYRLAYRAGTNILRSHLISVTQCDGAGVCLPATTFGWQGTTSIDISTSSYSVTPGFQVVPGDWDANGLTDYAKVFTTCTSSSFPVYLGQSSFGFSLSGYTLDTGMPVTPFCDGPVVGSTILAPDGTSNQIITETQYSPNQVYYAAFATSAGAISLANTTLPNINITAGDFNGDGIPDYFTYQNPTSYVYLGSTGGSFSPDGGHSVSGNGIIGDLKGGDFDGDGCTDILSFGSPTSYLYYAWSCNPATATGTTPSLLNSETTGDFNGDGKTDIIVAGGADVGLWLATGTGFVNVNSSIPGNISAVGDWNGDGKADLVTRPSTNDLALYLSTGTGFVQALDQNGNPVSLSGVVLDVVPVVADWDSNGNSDVLAHFPIAGGGATDTFNLIAYTPELMISVSNGIGATTTVAYDRINKGGSFYSKGSAATYPLQNMIGPQYVVSEVNTSNGLGTCTPPSSSNCYRTTYAYEGAQKDLRGRGFLGFTKVVATDQQTSIVRTTNYCVNFPLVGLVRSEARVNGAVTLSTVSNYYNGSGTLCGGSASSGVNVVNLTRSDTTANDLNGAALPSTSTTYTYDSYGNALTVNVSVSDGSSKNTTNTYWNDTTNWFLGRLLTTSVNSTVGSSSWTRQSSFSYDSGTGLLTVESIEPGVNICNAGSDSCTLSTSYTYDAFGHRVTTTVYGTGITSRTSYAFYDGIGQFQTSAANALGQYEFWTFDSRFGTPLSHTGPNGLTTSWSYDSFGRMTLETRPDGTKTASSYAYCGGGCPTYGQFYATTQQFANNGSTQIGPSSTSYFDMLARGIATDTQGFDGSTIRVAAVYDTESNVAQTSRPYFTASASPAWTTFTYDDLGRVTLAVFPDGSDTAYGYNGLTTTVTNDLGQVITTVKNAQGLNYQVTDAASNTTTYIYDAFGNLRTVTDPLGNVITNTFDIRGNKVVSVDPDMGSWTYTYDVLAELTSRTDAKGQTTTLTYDVLGRALTRTEPGLYSEWTYGTSAGDRNVGQLIQAKACPTSGCSTVVSDKIFQFDSTGRPSQTYIKTATDIFGYKTTYNGTNGQMASVTYPSGLVVSRSYNSYGYLTQLTGPGSEVIWTGVARDAELHLTSQTAGNGVNTTQAFSSATGMIQNQRAGPSGAVASFDYAFDAIGNLTTRTDNSQPYTERFCYDSLNRLTNYNIGAACTGGKTVAYNAIGNITSKSDTGTYSYPSAGSNRPHAVSSITGTVDGLTNPSYSYDANGNLTCVSSGAGCSGTIKRTVNMTSFNMAQSMIQDTNSLSLAYDDQHQRISQVNTVSGTTTTTTVYLNDPSSGAMSERVSVAGTTPTLWNSFTWGTDPWGGTTPNTMPTWTDYIAVDGQIIAQRKIQYPQASAWGFQNWNSFNWGMPVGNLWNGFNWGAANWSGSVVSWAYFNLDHLGSVAVITDQGGNVVQRLSFDAWGKQRNANGTDVACGTISSSTTRGYTNQEEMPAQCLVNLNARIYDASIGKFMAADSIVPKLYKGQSFNRYSYVGNNPLSLVDPSGHQATGYEAAFDVEEVTVSEERVLRGYSSILHVAHYGDPAERVIETAQKTAAAPSTATVSQVDAMKGRQLVSSTCSRVIGAGCTGSFWDASKVLAGKNSNAKKTRAAENSKGVTESQSEIDTDAADSQPSENFPTCAFLCSLVGGPVDIKDASGNVIGTYNREVFEDSMEAAGTVAGVMDAAAASAIGGTAAPILGPTGPVFGRSKLGGSSVGDINANDNLRIGWGWSGTQAEGTHVFRISGKWIDALMGAKRSHIDLFKWGGR